MFADDEFIAPHFTLCGAATFGDPFGGGLVEVVAGLFGGVPVGGFPVVTRLTICSLAYP